ncbi:MAG TPA: UTP--glucose-1-phosphate uridylyltransferase [Verrucomicrobia bacterium]|nr:UTP--glucose-1-phosphate uridylyltransferase [Verrucomicrobiota bacterium]
MNPRPIEADIRDRMAADGAPPLVIDAFLQNLRRWNEGDLGVIPGSSLAPIGDLARLENLDELDPAGETAIARTVLIKLNGGLGTSMGLERAKSLIVAKNGLSFLDIIVRQVEFLRRRCHAPLPLLFMNSFSTEADSLEAIAQGHPGFGNGEGLPLSFCQHRVPKLDLATRAPVRWPENPALEWCPPGHADIYHALQTTGLLDTLLERGFRHAFVSNADNLGAILHMGILAHVATHRIPFLMEVTARTECDRKGGHLARDRQTGRLLLRESAQCPPGETADFQDISKYRLFNTNNLWLDLEALRDMLRASHGLPPLPLIVNRKTVDPTRPDSPAVVQLEAAMGSAIAGFDRAEALVVPRFRFAPVKTTNDLLAIRSDLYTLGEEHQVALHPLRFTPPPDISLDPRYYKNIADFEPRFAQGAPSLLQCDSLQIDGDIHFGANVRIEGSVHLRNPTDKPARIADGSRVHTPVRA